MKNIILILTALAGGMQLMAQGTLQLTTGSYIKSASGGYLVLENINIVNNGTLQQYAGNGFIKLTGNIPVSLSGSGVTTIDELLMERTGNATFDLQTNLTVVTKVNFSGGNINLNGKILDLGNTGIFSNESETSRAFTSGLGYVQRTKNLNAPSSDNVGNLGAMISSTSNLGATVIRRGHAVQTGVSGSNNSIRRFYDIVPANNQNLKAVLRFFYFDAELNSITEASLHQWKSKNNVNWDFVGANTRDESANFVEKISINKFERFTLATAAAPTINCQGPISTSANLKGCKATVSFAATATGIPTPVLTYRIGNTIITSPYVFSKGTTNVTVTASNGITPDANCTFSVTVSCGGSGARPTSSNAKQKNVVEETVPEISNGLEVIAFPNPSAGQFTINVKGKITKERISMQVVDQFGRNIESKNNISDGAVIRLGYLYRPGIYFVRITQGKEHKEIKLIKL